MKIPFASHGNRTTRRALLPAASLAAAAALSPGQATAQQAQPEQPLLEGSINVQKFTPAPGPRNYLVTRGARTDGKNAFSLGLIASFGRDPFVIATDSGDTNVVQGLVTGNVLVSYTPVPIFQLGLNLPVTYVKGNGVNPVNGESGTFTGQDIAATGISDPELEGKFRIVGEATDPFVLGAALFLGAPLGNATAKDSYIGSDSVSAGARVIADVSLKPLMFAANVGYRYKQEGRIDQTQFGSDLLYGVGVGLAATPSIHILADAFGSSQFSSDPSTNAAEVDGALRYVSPSGSWSVQLGGGAGLAAGSVGVPSYRALLGFGINMESTDTDGDGKSDDEDACPTEPEDMDGFEDNDGCPDNDNDGDAIMDDVDKCPNQAEDMDKFEDTDGCPDPDNDKDGVKDTSDRCPDEPETINGFEDEDGCPDTPDRDKDGVPDDKDKCPDQAEDTDGYQDTDGCPDPDNDGDGIPDDRDECVDTPEDMNGVDDEDGCPDADE